MSEAMDSKKVNVKYAEIGKLELNYYTTELNGREVQLVSHDSLEDAILNQVPVELKARYDFNIIKSQRDFVREEEGTNREGNVALQNIYRNHAIVECIIADAKGRRVVSIGEATENTLTTEIAKDIPVTQASIRAFDRAAIRYLGLPGKVFANSEIPADEVPKSSSVEEKESVQRKEEQASTAEMASTAEAPVENMAEKTPDIPEEKNASKTDTEPSKTEEINTDKDLDETDLEKLGATIFTFGKYRDQPIKDICNKKDDSWFEFMLETYSTKDNEKKKLVDCLRAYKRVIDKKQDGGAA